MLTSSSSFALIGHRTLELYYFILLLLFYFILFYFILFYFILFYFILFYFILFYFILFYFILFYFILFYFILFLFYFILFYFCETSQYLALFTATIFPISTPTRTVRRHHLPYLHPNPHCSPKFGLYRFFNIFLQNPYLLTWRIWRKKFGLGRFFNIFSSDFLSFNMAHLARHILTIYTTSIELKNKFMYKIRQITHGRRRRKL